MGLWKDKTRKDWCYRFEFQKKSYAGRGFNTKKEAIAAREERRKEVKNQPIGEGMAYSEAINLYLDYAERAFATKTFKYKKYVYKSFYLFLNNDMPIRKITTQIIDSYLMTRPSNNNYNVHKKDLSAFFTYAKDILEVVDSNPVIKLKNIPHTIKEKVIPPEEDIIKLLLAANPKTDEKDLLIVLLHSLGRIDEILRLTWADINFEKRVLIKRTKKTKDRAYKQVPVKINEELYQTLWKMWQAREQDTWVFYNQRTETRYFHRPKFMKGLCKRAGIEPYFTFHTLRHLMASLMDDNPKIATTTIQKILGHAKEQTTHIYLHKSIAAVDEAMDSISGKFTQKKEKTATNNRNQKQKRLST